MSNSAEGEQVAGDKVTCVAEQPFDMIGIASAEVTMSLFPGMIHSPIATSRMAHRAPRQTFKPDGAANVRESNFYRSF